MVHTTINNPEGLDINDLWEGRLMDNYRANSGALVNGDSGQPMTVEEAYPTYTRRIAGTENGIEVAFGEVSNSWSLATKESGMKQYNGRLPSGDYTTIYSPAKTAASWESGRDDAAVFGFIDNIDDLQGWGREPTQEGAKLTDQIGRYANQLNGFVNDYINTCIFDQATEYYYDITVHADANGTPTPLDNGCAGLPLA